MPEPRLVYPPPDGLWRVARLPDALEFPGAELENDGSGPLHGRRRFEDPRGEFGVLYCASSIEAAFGDDIAQYRPRVVGGNSIRDWISDFFGTGPDPHEPQPGQLPGSYFDDRVVMKVMIWEDARFVDLEDPTTHAALDEGLADMLADHGLANFDRGVVMGSDRHITGAIARYFYSLSQRPGFADLIGLRYESRFAPEWERWAIWDYESVYVSADEPTRPVTHGDPSLGAAAARLNITVPPV